MISKKLTDLIDRIDRTEPTLARRAALEGLKLRLEAEAPDVACVRCADACWVIGWGSLGEGGGDKEWLHTLGKCGKNLILPQGEDPDGGGEDVVFCTEATETAAV